MDKFLEKFLSEGNKTQKIINKKKKINIFI